MTKIITSENRIIFDGHAKTKEECETISLICEQLAKSEKFNITTPAVTENSDGSVDLKI